MNNTLKTLLDPRTVEQTKRDGDSGVFDRPKYRYHIDENDMGIEYRDEGPWRSYSITADGDSLQELLLEATIGETDQDGGELNCYGIDDAPNEVEKRAYEIIENAIKRAGANHE